MGSIWTIIWTAQDRDCQDGADVYCTESCRAFDNFADDDVTVYEGAEPDPEEDAILRVFWRQQRSVETPEMRRKRIHAATCRVLNFQHEPSKLSTCIYGKV